MSGHSGFKVRQAEWSREAASIRAVRLAVFVEEQGIAAELEWDGRDEASVHALAQTGDGRAMGTARMQPDGHIGRMAVLAPFRRRGVGSALLETLIDIAHRSGLAEVWLDAQCTAVPFYAARGFAPVGPVFTEAGIAHQRMIHRLRPVREPKG